MKILNQTTVIVVAKAEPTKSQDGRSTFYRVACLQNGQATNLSAPEDVYHELPSGMVEVRFNTSYDDTYKSFRIDSIDEVISVNGARLGVKDDAKPDAKPSGNATAK